MLQGEIKNRRATQCVQQEYSWLLAALAELRLAHSRQRHAPLLSITRHRRATVMATIIGHEMDVPRGGRFRAETAHPTKVRGWRLEHLEWVPPGYAVQGGNCAPYRGH
jgi:hypothetical protein